MISTGLSKLDNFLSGGISHGTIVDIFGESGTGKTQLILQICVNAIKNDNTILFIDTTGNFRPERLLELHKQKNNSIDILDRITVSRITNTSEQIHSNEKIKNSNFSLIVIDNITELFSYEYQKDELVYKKNSLFMKYMHDLALIGINKKLPIVITNTVRNINNQLIENMSKVIEPYTHIKIQLSKEQSNFKGTATWIENKLTFAYQINPNGLEE